MYSFALTILEGRGETQNNFVYCLKSRHAVIVIRYWFDTKYVKNMFSLMYIKGDNNPNQTMCFSVLNRELLMFVKNWNAYINDSTRARCYILYGNFRFQPYLNLIHIEKNHCLALEYRLTGLKLVK